MKFKLKLFFFVQYLSVGIVGPYFALYLYQKDFTGTQIGLLLGSMPVAVMVLQPIWSTLSDILNTRRNLLVISSIAMSVSILGLGASTQFLPTMLWVLLYAGFRAPIQPISTAIVLDYLEEEQRPQDFGFTRLWGSLAFAISSMVLGSLFLDNILDFFTWILFGLYLISAGISLFMPEREARFNLRVIDGLKFLPKNPEFLVYLLGSAFIGATISIGLSYQTIFLQALESPAWLLGLTVSLPALLEVPLMFLVPALSKRLSWSVMILIGAVALPIRWGLYLFIENPVWILPTQILHSIAVVSFMVVGVSFIDKRIHQKWRATSQGLYSTAMGGIGSGVGLYLAGNVLDRFDVRAIWALNFILGLLGFLFIIFALRKYQVIGQKEKVKGNTCQIM